MKLFLTGYGASDALYPNTMSFHFSHLIFKTPDVRYSAPSLTLLSTVISFFQIQDYYGDKVGFYYAFLAYYCSSLRILAILGLLAQLALYFIDHTSILHAAMTASFSVLLLLWGIAFLSYWRLKESLVMYAWSVRPQRHYHESGGYDPNVQTGGMYHHLYAAGQRLVDFLVMSLI